MKKLLDILFPSRSKRICKNDIIDPNAIKALRDISKEAQRASYSLLKAQKATRYLNETVNNLVWKKIDKELPEMKEGDSSQSIDVLCLSEKRIKVVSSYNRCEMKWNTKLKITHWTYLPKDP